MRGSKTYKISCILWRMSLLRMDCECGMLTFEACDPFTVPPQTFAEHCFWCHGITVRMHLQFDKCGCSRWDDITICTDAQKPHKLEFYHITSSRCCGNLCSACKWLSPAPRSTFLTQVQSVDPSINTRAAPHCCCDCDAAAIMGF